MGHRADPGRPGGPHPHPPADLRRRVAPPVRQPAAVSPRLHHQPAAQDRGRSDAPAADHHGARRRLPDRATADVTRRIRWPPARASLLWGAIFVALTAVMRAARSDIGEPPLALVYLLLVLGGSVAGAGAPGVARAPGGGGAR